jgi:acyl carrier protein
MALEEEVWDEVIAPAVADHFGGDKKDVSRSRSLLKDYAADSLDLVEVAMNIEEGIETRYSIPGFSIPEDMNPQPRNLGELCSYIVGRVEKERGN